MVAGASDGDKLMNVTAYWRDEYHTFSLKISAQLICCAPTKPNNLQCIPGA